MEGGFGGRLCQTTQDTTVKGLTQTETGITNGEVRVSGISYVFGLERKCH